jgi:hypothetical protein
MITQKDLFEILHYCKDTGIFVWKKRLSNRIKIGDIANHISHLGYIEIRIKGKLD